MVYFYCLFAVFFSVWVLSRVFLHFLFFSFQGPLFLSFGSKPISNLVRLYIRIHVCAPDATNLKNADLDPTIKRINSDLTMDDKCFKIELIVFYSQIKI